MFNLFEYKAQSEVFSSTKTLAKLGSVSIGPSNNLGKGVFSPIDCRRGGRTYKLRAVLKNVTVGPQGSMFTTGQYGDKCDAFFTLSASQEAELASLCTLHEQKLFLKHTSVDDVIQLQTELLSDQTTITVKVKVSPKVSGDLWEEEENDLEGKSSILSNCETPLDVTLFISGYYFNPKENSIRLCMTCVNVDKNRQTVKRR